MEMYAARKGWELGEVEVEVEMEYGQPAVPSSFVVILRLSKELTEEQVERLKVIAGKVPGPPGVEPRDRGLDRGPGRAGLDVDLGLDGKACAITGASRGIGREVARRLCAEGASALLVARSPTRSPRPRGNASSPAAGPSPWPSTSPSRTPASESSPPPRRASASSTSW